MGRTLSQGQVAEETERAKTPLRESCRSPVRPARRAEQKPQYSLVRCVQSSEVPSAARLENSRSTSSTPVTACSAARRLDASFRFSRPAIARKAIRTSSECRTKATRCSPLGPYFPANQFLIVFSLAPVHPSTVFTPVLLSPSSRRSVAAITCAKEPAAPSACTPSYLFSFGKNLPFFGNDIPTSLALHDGRDSALDSGGSNGFVRRNKEKLA